jgi:amino acid transporter
MSNDNSESKLVRALGVRQLSASIFNYTVGSGIFALPAVAVAQLGTAAPLAYLVCMIVMALVLLCFAEAGSRVSQTGGPYAYVETALGPFVGFIAGVMLLLTGISAGAAVTVLFAKSATALVPSAPTWLPNAIIVTVIALLMFANVRGVQKSARLIEGITIAKVLPLIAFVIVGAFFVTPANWHWEGMPTTSNVLGTAGIVIFAFSGIESALAPSGEVRNPSRTVPLAAFIALGAATALYLAIQWVALGVEGLALGNEKFTPLANAASTFAGSAGKTIMIVGATISMLGYLSANILSVPRSWYALGRDAFLPKFLSTVHSEYHTPHFAIGLHGLLLGGLALTGTFQQLAVFANLTAFVLYILCAIAVWQLRRSNVHSGEKPFLIPGGPLIPIATVGANAWLIYATAERSDAIGMLWIMGVSLLLYGIRWLRLNVANFPFPLKESN